MIPSNLVGKVDKSGGVMKRISKHWAIVAVIAVAASLGAAGATAGGKTLALVAYSTPKDAYSQIIPAFQKTSAGKGVNFNQSYGPSGQQSRAVKNGLSGDIVAFALEPYITRLVGAHLVSPKWNRGKYKGMVTDSVTVFVTRQGNPKHIRSWKDLIKPGVKVVNANPFLSGGARWNVMAAYGSLRQAPQRPALLQDPERDDPDRESGRCGQDLEESPDGQGVREVPVLADRAE